MPGTVFTIGKSAGNDFVVSNSYVSGSHARLVKSGNSFVIEDMGSRNGTYVNGSRVSRQMVSFGDRIELSTHYKLDWNNPRLRNWMLGIDQSANGSHPIINSSLIPNDNHSATVSHQMMPVWLLTLIGAFFFFFYVLPVSEGLFLWNILGDSFKNGMGFLFIGMAGIAISVLAHTTKGLPRAVVSASIGFVGLILYFISTGDALSSSTPVESSIVLTIFASIFLLGMMMMNNVAISIPQHSTIRLIAGIMAAVYMILITTIQILSIGDYSSIGSGAGFIITFSILGFLANLAGGVIMTINIKDSHENKRSAVLAQNLILVAISAQAFLFSLAVFFVSGGDSSWTFFLLLRMFGFTLGLALLLGGGISDVIKFSIGSD